MPVGLPLALGAVSSIAGGVGNAIANMSANDRAAALQNQALQNWLKVQIPDPKEQQLALQRFVQQGTLDPKLETAIKANPSEFSKIVSNPSYSAAQDKALSQLEDIGDHGGLRLQDKEAIQESQIQNAAKARANAQGIADTMAQRGASSSGFDVAAKLQNQQGAADRNAQSSMDVAAKAQDRALQSIEGAGNLATQLKNQDFSQQAEKAGAADRINLFNTTNLQNVQQRNVGTQNAAQAANLAAKQQNANQNVNTANQEQEKNKQLLQQQFENETKKAAGETGQYNNLAGTATQQGQNLGNTFSNAGGAINSAAGTGAYYNYLDEYLKNKTPKYADDGTKLDENGEVPDSWYKV